VIYRLIAWVIDAILPPGKERVSGAEAVRWEVGYYTKNRMDLPYPDKSRLKVII
jgi:hypothetical protein